ncbi:zf-HC2 domain-containing protein [bacterium]|nr:zf-HC2 domain-containing protein [bacterium]
MNGFRDNGRDRSERFLNDVLARTSGPACGRALDLLPGLTDGELGDLDRRLVQGHLEHCPQCLAVAVVMGWLGGALGSMAVVDPGEAFTRRVLARTSGAAALEAERRRLTGAAGLMDRLGRWWEDRIQRPAFAMQAAYAATVVLVLLTAVPGAPLKQLPGQALELVQAGPDQSSIVGRALGGAGGWVESRTGVVVDSGRGGLASGWGKVHSAWTERADRTAADRAELRARVGDVVDQAGRGRLGQAGYRLWEAGKAFGSFWNHWWTSDRQADAS